MPVQIDMDMPKNCKLCPIRGNEDTCQLVNGDYVIGYNYNRHPFCLLNEVK